MWLFWHLARSRNPHLHIVNCGFSNFGNLQNSLHYTIFMGGVALLASALKFKIQNSRFKIQNLRKVLSDVRQDFCIIAKIFYSIINSSVVSFGT